MFQEYSFVASFMRFPLAIIYRARRDWKKNWRRFSCKDRSSLCGKAERMLQDMAAIVTESFVGLLLHRKSSVSTTRDGISKKRRLMEISADDFLSLTSKYCFPSVFILLVHSIKIRWYSISQIVDLKFHNKQCIVHHSMIKSYNWPHVRIC